MDLVGLEPIFQIFQICSLTISDTQKYKKEYSTKLASTPLCSHSRTRTYTPLINSQVHYSILLCENICFHMRTWTPIYRFVACRSFHWTMWKNCTDSRSRTHIKWFGVICLTIRRCPYLTFVSVEGKPSFYILKYLISGL